jgi:glycosyltransferase involved in cell wall biosynthesis
MNLKEGDGDLVSVIIPTYYRNDMLEAAIESVYRQEYRPIELVVVDDSGEANAEPVMLNYDDATYVALDENRGAQAARNVGMEHTSGEYVQFLDDDDVLREDKFAEQVPLMNDDVGVVYSGLELLETGEVVRPKPDVRGDVLEDALRMRLYPCSNCTMVMDRSVLEELLPFKNRHAADDVGMQIELAQRTEFEYVDEPLIYVRDNVQDSLSATWAHFDAREELLSQYDHLYEQFPPEVKRTALSGINYLRAKKHMRESLWSVGAILAYGRSAYYTPVNRPIMFIEFLTSFFGRPGLKLADRIKRFSREYLVT